MTNEQEARFLDSQKTLEITRAFWDKYRTIMLGTSWYCFYGWQAKWEVPANGNDHKEIARALGKNGWKRVADTYTCGQINWVKTVDGVEVVLQGAEMLRPKLIEEVKFPDTEPKETNEQATIV